MKMRNLFRFGTVLVVGALLGMTSLWVSPIKATPLTNVDLATFNSWLGPVVAPPMTRNFDFVPTNSTFPGPDGAVTSVVYKGVGDVADLYVYVYQIVHFNSPPSSEGKIEGMSFDLLGLWAVPPVLTEPGSVAFQVIGSGNKPLYDASITVGPLGIPPSISFTFPSPPPPPAPSTFLLPGETSWVFGFFSPMPPTTTVADVRDTGNTLLSPTVYTPSPEPSAFVLLGIGLLGGIWWRRRLR